MSLRWSLLMNNEERLHRLVVRIITRRYPVNKGLVVKIDTYCFLNVMKRITDAITYKHYNYERLCKNCELNIPLEQCKRSCIKKYEDYHLCVEQNHSDWKDGQDPAVIALYGLD